MRPAQRDTLALPPLAARAALVAILAVFGVLSLRFVPETIDDSYIALRYASHLASGHGLGFNTIGPPVEGFSNFSWVVLLAAFQRLGVSPVAAMKAISFAAAVATLVLIYLTGRRRFGSPAPALFAAGLFGVSSFHALWAVDGLETMFFACLLAGALHRLTCMDQADHGVRWIDGVILGVLLALLTLTRPEGLFYALLLPLCGLRNRAGWKPILVALALVSLAAAGYAAFRLTYFGHLLSNTAANKFHPGIGPLLRGAGYLRRYGMDVGIPVTALLVTGAYTALRQRRLDPSTVIAGAGVLFILLAGGDFMYGYRFFVHIAAPVCLLAATGMVALRTRLHLPVWGSAALAASCLAWSAISTYHAVPSQRPFFRVDLEPRSVHFRIAAYLRGLRPSPSEWLLLSEAGIIPYRVDMQVYDYLGLVSPYREVYPHGAPDLQAMFRRSPRFVLLTTTLTPGGTTVGRLSIDQAILGAPGFPARYRLRQRFAIPKDGDLLDRLYYHHDRFKRELSFVLYERIS